MEGCWGAVQAREWGVWVRSGLARSERPWLFCEAGAQEGMTGPVGAEEGAQADGPASGTAQGERPPEQ